MYLNNFIALQHNSFGKMPEYSITTTFTEDAEDLFVDAKEKLLDVNNWKRYSGITGIEFRLTDGHGRPVKRKAHRGDHIKINFPGQSMADEHCCVVIEAIEYDDYPDLDMEAFTMRVRPCESSMHKAEEDNDYNEAEGSLVIERRNKKIFATYNSRNDAAGKVSNRSTENNWFGLTDAQWDSLVKGFVA
jgi:hypothetical protein